MRCDLHVHTLHSGMCGIPFLNRFCRESYSDPLDLYNTLKQRGMDLVTVTDHDSIEAMEALRHRADFFLSEEVTCTTPSKTEIHIGVYGIYERHHEEMQRRRNDLPALTAYLNEQKLFFSINHVFSCLTGRRADLDFALFEQFIPGVETINGHMPQCSNRYASELARSWRKAPVAGSDSHTLAGLGRTYTEVPGANSVETYLNGLCRGRSNVCGKSGSYLTLTRAIAEIGLQMTGEIEWTIALTPLLLAIPFVTLVNYIGEVIFATKWARRMITADRELLNVNYLAPDAE